MEFLSSLKDHFSISKKEMYTLLTDLLNENEELKEENNNYKNDYLATENRILEERYKELEEKYFDNLTDNEYLEKRVKEMEIDLEDYYDLQVRQQERLEDYLLYGSDNPYYIEKYNPKLYEEILKNNDLEEENQMYSEKIEELTDQLEINERLDTDKLLEEDYYSTKELDYGLLSKTIDKITEERNTYKEVINIMCDKFDISHDSVLDIIDDMSQNKSVEKERV